jgi:hypothetical protein
MNTSITRLFRRVLVPVIASSCVAQTLQAIPTLSLSSAPASIAAGDTFSVDVNISGISDLFAWQFDVGFAPELASAQGLTEGPFLSGGGGTFFIEGVTDNTLGTISGTAASLLSAVSGVSGDGVLTSLVFAAVAQGTALFTLSNVILLDSVFGDLSVSLETLSLTIGPKVEPPVGVPEPSVLALFMAGAGALALVGNRRRRRGLLAG